MNGEVLPEKLSIYATNEVWLAVIASTLTIIAVFFPMTMVSGMMGVMFQQLGWIVTITIGASALAAITLTPMLSSRMLKLESKKKKPARISHDKIILPVLTNWMTTMLKPWIGAFIINEWLF